MFRKSEVVTSLGSAALYYQPVLYYDFDKICAGEIFDESGLGNNGMSRGRVVVEAGYNGDNGLKSREKSREKKPKGEKKVETEKIERKI